jgi:hypothetical protein
MVAGAIGALIDLVKLRDVTSLERRRSDPPRRRQHAQPTGQQGQGEDRSGGRRGPSRVAMGRHS